MAGRGERLVRTANGGGERRKQPIIAVVVVRRSDGAWFHFVIEHGGSLVCSESEGSQNGTSFARR